MNDTLSPGTKNCSWTSCREGCTKELYDCTQIRVNYKLPVNASEDSDGQGEGGGAVGGVEDDEDSTTMDKPRYERSLREYDYVEDLDEDFAEDDEAGLPKPFPTGTEQRTKTRYPRITINVIDNLIIEGLTGLTLIVVLDEWFKL